MNYTSIAENIVASVATAVLVWLALWSYTVIRNLKLEKKLMNAIDPNGVGIQFDPINRIAEFTLQIHNYTNASIRIRGVVLMADKFHIELTPTDKIYQTPLSNEMTRDKFPRLYLSKGVLGDDNNKNSMLLQAKTMGVWKKDLNEMSPRDWKIGKVFIVIEYGTLFGNSALIRVEAGPSCLKLVKDNFEELNAGYLAVLTAEGKYPKAN